MGITTTYKQIVFAVLCCLWAALYSPAAHAQNPPCAVAGDAGNAYESCASGFCEGLICNGSAYATLSGRNFSGWESIKFGNDTSTCNSTRSGRLRYTGGSTWEYCNGSAWTSLTGGGGSGPTYIMGNGSGQVAGTTTPTSLMTVSIPANAINTTRPFRVKAYGRVLNNSGSSLYFFFRGVYGGTWIGSVNADTGLSSMGSARPMILSIDILPTSTTTVSGAITILVLNVVVGIGHFHNVTIPATTSARDFSFDVSMGASGPVSQINAVINRYEVEY